MKGGRHMTINLNHSEIVSAVTEAIKKQLQISQPIEVVFNPRKGGSVDATIKLLTQEEVAEKEAKINSVREQLGINQAELEPASADNAEDFI